MFHRDPDPAFVLFMDPAPAGDNIELINLYSGAADPGYFIWIRNQLLILKRIRISCEFDINRKQKFRVTTLN